MKVWSLLMVLFVSCFSALAQKHAIVVLGEHTTKKEIQDQHMFSWSKNVHVFELGYVGGNDVGPPQEAAFIENMVRFDPALSDQSFRPGLIQLADLRFKAPKRRILPEPIEAGWLDTTFQKTRTIQILDDDGSSLTEASLYLPLPLHISFAENEKHFTFDWEPDSLNPYGLSIWFNAVRGPNTGYRGKLQGHNVTYNLDDACGHVELPKAALPSWIWEDPAHTSLRVLAFRRSQTLNKMTGKKQKARIVCTQGMQYDILEPNVGNP